MPEIIERTAKLFEAGDYPDKGVQIDTDALDSIVAGFQSIPVKVEHSETPFDGALGNCTRVWREGNDLKGSIGFTPEAWGLIDKAGARKLSIGIKKDLSALTEVSLVKNPRIASAAVFDDRIEVNGALVPDRILIFASWGGMTSDDIEEQIKSQCKTGEWCYVEELGQDYCVVCNESPDMECTYTKYSYKVEDKKVILSDPQAVKEQTKWIPAETMMTADSNTATTPHQEVKNMADTKQDAPAVGVEMISKEEAEARFSSIESENRELRFKLRESEVNAKIDALKRAGKITPAMEPMAKDILMCQAETVNFDGSKVDVSATFAKMLDAMPVIVDFSEQGDNSGTPDTVNYSTEVVDIAAKLGASTEALVKWGGN